MRLQGGEKGSTCARATTSNIHTKKSPPNLLSLIDQFRVQQASLRLIDLLQLHQASLSLIDLFQLQQASQAKPGRRSELPLVAEL